MLEWIYAVQRLIDFIDENAADNPSLEEISRQVGYSPYYCMGKIRTFPEYYIERGEINMQNKSITGGYAMELKKIDDNKHLIGMVSVDEILRFGYEAGLNENSKVLDLTYGYGTTLKVWAEAFGITGTVVEGHPDFAAKGRERLAQAGVEDKIRIVCEDRRKYADTEKYDLVVCTVGTQIPPGKSLEYIQNSFSLGEKFLKSGGTLAYVGTYSKIPDPPEELVDFEGELLVLSELNRIFRELGYCLTSMAGDTNAMWEHYAVNWHGGAKEAVEALRKDINDDWVNKWERMYFDYRRPYQGQALFGLEKL